MGECGQPSVVVLKQDMVTNKVITSAGRSGPILKNSAPSAPSASATPSYRGGNRPRIAAVHGTHGRIRFLQFTPDGTQLVSASNGDHVEIKDGKAVMDHRIAGGDNSVRVWNVETGDQVQQVRLHGGPTTTALRGFASPPTAVMWRRLSSWFGQGPTEPMIYVWDTVTGNRTTCSPSRRPDHAAAGIFRGRKGALRAQHGRGPPVLVVPRGQGVGRVTLDNKDEKDGISIRDIPLDGLRAGRPLRPRPQVVRRPRRPCEAFVFGTGSPAKSSGTSPASPRGFF